MASCPDCDTPFESVFGVPGTIPERCSHCGRKFRKTLEAGDYIYGDPNRITSVAWCEWDRDLYQVVLKELEELSSEVAPNVYRLVNVFCQGNGHFCGDVVVETVEAKVERERQEAEALARLERLRPKAVQLFRRLGSALDPDLIDMKGPLIQAMPELPPGEVFGEERALKLREQAHAFYVEAVRVLGFKPERPELLADVVERWNPE